LEKEETNSPNTRPAAEPGQKVLANDRLHLEKKERSNKNRERVRRHALKGVNDTARKPEPISRLFQNAYAQAQSHETAPSIY
jgi:hypothetical protein